MNKHRLWTPKPLKSSSKGIAKVIQLEDRVTELLEITRSQNAILVELSKALRGNVITPKMQPDCACLEIVDGDELSLLLNEQDDLDGFLKG